MGKLHIKRLQDEVHFMVQPNVANSLPSMPNAFFLVTAKLFIRVCRENGLRQQSHTYESVYIRLPSELLCSLCIWRTAQTCCMCAHSFGSIRVKVVRWYGILSYLVPLGLFGIQNFESHTHYAGANSDAHSRHPEEQTVGFCWDSIGAALRRS